MSSWRDNINLGSCIWFESEEFKRNSMSAAISGVLFFIGWWLLIDADVTHSDTISTWYYIWGILGTISLIMVNAVSQSQVPNYNDSYFGISGTSAWLFVGFVLGFASVIASFLIFFTDFYSKNQAVFPGFELLFQNVLIFVSSLIYKFGRVEDQF